MALKFDVADLYIKVPSGSNRLFLCPLDVLLHLYAKVPSGSNRLFLCPLDVLHVTVLPLTCFVCTSDLMSCYHLKG